MRIDARDLHPRRQPESFGYACRARTPDILAGDDINCGWGHESVDRLFGRRGYFDLREFLETERLQVLRRLLFVWLCRGDNGQQNDKCKKNRQSIHETRSPGAVGYSTVAFQLTNGAAYLQG